MKGRKGGKTGCNYIMTFWTRTTRTKSKVREIGISTDEIKNKLLLIPNIGECVENNKSQIYCW